MKKQSRGLNIHEDYRGIEGAESLMIAANEMLKVFGLELSLEYPQEDDDQTREDDEHFDTQLVVLKQKVKKRLK